MLLYYCIYMMYALNSPAIHLVNSIRFQLFDSRYYAIFNGCLTMIYLLIFLSKWSSLQSKQLRIANVALNVLFKCFNTAFQLLTHLHMYICMCICLHFGLLNQHAPRKAANNFVLLRIFFYRYLL